MFYQVMTNITNKMVTGTEYSLVRRVSKYMSNLFHEMLNIDSPLFDFVTSLQLMFRLEDDHFSVLLV